MFTLSIEFGQFLRDVVWSTPDASPALAGTPVARVLTTADEKGDSPEQTGEY